LNADGTDYFAVRQGYVSVTPMRSDMTNHNALDQIAGWGEVRGDEAIGVGESPALEHA
jgi:formate dehydrogenase assembly factor FdhD